MVLINLEITLGVKEHIIFPEVSFDRADKVEVWIYHSYIIKK